MKTGYTLTHRFRLSIGVVLAAVACGILLLLSLLASGAGATRTFVIEALASGADITFEGTANSWTIGEATLCLQRSKPLVDLPRGDGACDARRYTEQEAPFDRIDWADGARVSVRAGTEGTVVLVVNGQTDLADGSRILLPADFWAIAGLQVFSGTIRVGETAARGATNLVISGAYEVRERPLWSSSTEVLKTGTLRHGEAIALKEAGRATVDAPTYGHLSAGTPENGGFRIHVLSAPSADFLEISYFGSNMPARIAPSWVDRALTSPFILALAVVFSLVLNAVQFLTGLTSFLRKPGG